MLWERLALLCVLIWGPQSAEAAEDEHLWKTHRAERLEFVKERLAELTVRLDQDPEREIRLAEHPALTWTNPVRGSNSGGAVFMYLDGQCPLVAANASIRDRGMTFFELTLLRDEPLRCLREEEVVWSPRKCAQPLQPLEEAPPPGESPVMRLAQMRALARRFDVGVLKGQRVRTRLLTQPLDRYADTQRNVLDGAVFVYVEATDPEVLLVLEARSGAAGKSGQWYYSFARQTSPEVDVRLHGRVVFAARPYWDFPRSKDDPYVEAFQGLYTDD